MLPVVTSYLPAYFITLFTHERSQIFNDVRRGYWLTHYLYDFQESALFELHGWCIMPDHVHLLFTPYTYKGRSSKDVAHSIVQRFRAVSGSFLSRHTQQAHAQFWDDHFDRRCISEEAFFWTFLTGIFYDPVHHGFVDDPVDYAFSSYHHFLHRHGTALVELLRAQYSRQSHPLHI